MYVNEKSEMCASSLGNKQTHAVRLAPTRGISSLISL